MPVHSTNRDQPNIHLSKAKVLAKRDSFLLRIDPIVLEALRRWADDDLRSINGQIEYLLRQCLQQAGRVNPPVPESAHEPEEKDTC